MRNRAERRNFRNVALKLRNRSTKDITHDGRVTHAVGERTRDRQVRVLTARLRRARYNDKNAFEVKRRAVEDD